MIRSDDDRAVPSREDFIDRRAEERSAPDLLEIARADATTRVLVISGDSAPLDRIDALMWLAPGDVPVDAEWGFLGRDGDGRAVLVAAVPSGAEPFAAPSGWGSLRSAAPQVSASEQEVLVEAVTLARWLVDAPFCPACGALAEVVDGGWSRRCPSCGRQHFPRTDPAVIVAITHPGDPDLVLLGRNALWGGNMYSCFAGFVEAGESLETTVHRELFEEAGVTVGAVRYLGSQPWPYPRSLMVGYLAEASDPDAARPDGEEIVDVRWFTRDEIAAGLRGEADFTLPGRASIARRIIAGWHADAAGAQPWTAHA